MDLSGIHLAVQNRTLGFQDLYFLNFVTCKEHHEEHYEGYLKDVHDGLTKLGIKGHNVFCSEKNQIYHGEEKICGKNENFCLLGHVFIASKVGYLYKNLQF